MSLLIVQNQKSTHSLATDSYGVISTAAMLGQEVSLVFCADGLTQLSDSNLIGQLEMAFEFGVKAAYVIGEDCKRLEVDPAFLPDDIQLINSADFSLLLKQSDKVLSF